VNEMSKVGFGLTLLQILVMGVVCILNPHVILQQTGMLAVAVLGSIGPWIITSSKGRNIVSGLILEGLYICSLVDLLFMLQCNIIV